jgi:predicted neutral ceramidase superfamily lipid hydrolase
MGRLGALDWAILIAVFAAAGGAVAFCVRFQILTGGAWQRTSLGRHLMFFTGAVAVAELLSVARGLFGEWPYRRVVLLVVFTAFAVLSWQRWLLLEQEQRQTPMEGGKDMGGNPSTRPVVLFTALVAGLQALLGVANLTDVMSENLVAWLQIIAVVVVAVGGVLTSNATTSLADPRDARGRTLVPSPPGGVPAGTDLGELRTARSSGDDEDYPPAGRARTY